MTYLLKDRRSAGRLLASYLTEYTNSARALVLALPRGGFRSPLKLPKGYIYP
jgi:putative phosphoribosyl transferase